MITGPIRWLIPVHRYLGIVAGLLMVMWCASGAVMLFVSYPELDEATRIRALTPIDWKLCCHFAPVLLDQVEGVRLESFGGRPILQVRASDGREIRVDLSTGGAAPRPDAATAMSVARAYATRTGLNATPAPPTVLANDQWTISGDFGRDRPLFKIELRDTHGTELYVSSTTGGIVQMTTATQRFWNYLGAVPHWLYWAELRGHAEIWSQIVIWSSLLGCFLTISGLALGWLRFRSDLRLGSPYAGIQMWHHIAGLTAGLLLLSWVTSGLFSMNPWGFLESGHSDAAARLAGKPLHWTEIEATLARIAARPPTDAVSIVSAPIDGRLYLLVTHGGGRVERMNAQGEPDSFDSDVLPASELLAAPAGVVSKDLLTKGDSYFSRDGEPGRTVYRVIANDSQHTRYYLDAITGTLLKRADANSRLYRWLHDAPHRFDFIPSSRSRPIREALVLLLLAGAMTSAATGACLAFRRVVRMLRARS